MYNNEIEINPVIVSDPQECPWCGISFDPEDEGTELVLEGRQGQLITGQKSGRLMVSDSQHSMTDKLVITVHPWCGLEVLIDWYTSKFFDSGEPLFGEDIYCAGCGAKLEGK